MALADRSPPVTRCRLDFQTADQGSRSRRVQPLLAGVPNFVIELRSQSDRVRVLREKMHEWLASGAQLGWLVDPELRTVEIYRPGFEAETRAGAFSIAGEGPVDGFVLDLAPVWDPLQD